MRDGHDRPQPATRWSEAPVAISQADGVPAAHLRVGRHERKLPLSKGGQHSLRPARVITVAATRCAFYTGRVRSCRVRCAAVPYDGRIGGQCKNLVVIYAPGALAGWGAGTIRPERIRKAAWGRRRIVRAVCRKRHSNP